jgi:hypothetical protein
MRVSGHLAEWWFIIVLSKQLLLLVDRIAEQNSGLLDLNIWSQCYKTFNKRNLLTFVISVCTYQSTLFASKAASDKYCSLL